MLNLGTARIGFARVFRMGGGADVKAVSTYVLSKTEYSSDLVHYFWEGTKFTFKNKNK